MPAASSANSNGGEKEKMLAETPPEDNSLTKASHAERATAITSENYHPTEEDVAYKGWKHLIPFRAPSKNPKTLPLIAAGPLNFATAHWATGLIYKAYKKGVDQTDLFDIPWRDSAGCNAKRFERCWNDELRKHGKEKASVARAIMRMIRARLIVAVFLTFSFSAFAILGPAIFTRGLLIEIQMAGPTDYFKCMIFSLGLAACNLCRLFLGSDAAAINDNMGLLAKSSAFALEILDQNRNGQIALR